MVNDKVIYCVSYKLRPNDCRGVYFMSRAVNIKEHSARLARKLAFEIEESKGYMIDPKSIEARPLVLVKAPF